jgi:hypothetical protein
MSRPPKPANEIETAVAKAYREPVTRQFRPLAGHYRNPVALQEIAFDLDKLKAVAGKISPPRNWRHWLWERSAKRPETQNAFSFLKCLYAPGERVMVFDKFETKRPLQIVEIADPMDCRVPAQLKAGGRYGSGAWYLCNPVDGEWHETGSHNAAAGEPILSCRDWHAVTSFRYAVLESDHAPADLWLAFLAQLPIRVTAIYTSGGKSIHCLVRLDAPSKQAWDDAIQPLKRPLKVLGADPGCLSAVRLTRLPGCHRPEKRGFQRLLYLSPNPPEARLVDLPVIHSRFEVLDRWRNLCPRWNENQEAFL